MRRILAISFFCFTAHAAVASPITVTSSTPGNVFGVSDFQQTVDISYTGLPNNRDLTVRAGQFSIGVPGFGASLLAFCVDIFNILSLPNSYNVTALTPGAPASFSSNQVTLITKLLKGITVDDKQTAAAKQLAIWEVVYETSGTYSLGSGHFKASNNALAIAEANTLFGLVSGTSIAGDATRLLTPAGTTPTQALVFFEGGGGSGVTVGVPEPASIALLGMGLLGLGLTQRRTRRG